MTNTVVLLHGLARTARSMMGMARFLQKNGYTCHNLDYPTRSHDIATLATEFVLPQIQQLANPPDFYVTHSMGGIVLRFLLENQWLQNQQIAMPTAIVMLSPPNQGSEIVDKIGHWRLFRLVNGVAGTKLGTDEQSLPFNLNQAVAQHNPPLDCNIGIITGTRSFDPFQLLLPSQNDGKVTVKSSQLAYMTDFLALPIGHTFMMDNKQVQQQTLHFLQNYQFQR